MFHILYQVVETSELWKNTNIVDVADVYIHLAGTVLVIFVSTPIGRAPVITGVAIKKKILKPLNLMKLTKIPTVVLVHRPPSWRTTTRRSGTCWPRRGTSSMTSRFKLTVYPGDPPKFRPF